jgi:hypothetical protein
MSSAQTLVDHTRIFMREHFKGTPILDEYERRLRAAFINDELSHFMKDLRNFVVHCGLPDDTLLIEKEFKDRVGGGIHLRTAKLRDWSGWTVPSKRYLDSHDRSIDILDAVTDYSAEVLDLNHWLDDVLLAARRAARNEARTR